ncbi:MAG: hypothetical protein NTU68_00875 [Actinobacteria bacterium]|nr:hypothetical protein [Actinomycetota bacterium]
MADDLKPTLVVVVLVTGLAARVGFWSSPRVVKKTATAPTATTAAIIVAPILRRWTFLRIKRWRSGREIGETVLVGENDVESVLAGGAGGTRLAGGASFLAAGAFFLAAGALGLLFALRGSDFFGIPIPVVVCVQFKAPLTVKNTTGAVHPQRAHKTLFFSFSGSNRAPGHGTACSVQRSFAVSARSNGSLRINLWRPWRETEETAITH